MRECRESRLSPAAAGSLSVAPPAPAVETPTVDETATEPCRRRDSNPRHADYDSGALWLYSCLLRGLGDTRGAMFARALRNAVGTGLGGRDIAPPTLIGCGQAALGAAGGSGGTGGSASLTPSTLVRP